MIMTKQPPLTATVGGYIQTNTDVCSTLMARDYKDPQIVCRPEVNMAKKITALHITQNPISSEAVTPCLSSGSTHGQAAIGVITDYTVRRLTPLECERLQGFPDNWTNIGEWEGKNGKAHKESTDSARYKALGNSIALPPWEYVLQRLSICCGDNVTMASLFDGIGGFPLIWERLNGKGSCLWASEIEDFPIAVTQHHFNQVQDNE